MRERFVRLQELKLLFGEVKHLDNQVRDKVASNNAVEKVFPHSIYVPYDPMVPLYQCTARPFAVPYEYTGWRDETISWKETCYLHGNLNPSPTYRIKGSEALKFLSDTCVNSFSNFPIGTGKHAIMCTEKGLVMMDGVLLRLDE